MTDYTQIIVTKADGIATITLNRPEKMNAYTRTMGAEIMAAMDDIDADDAVRAVIFTGSGERAFCAGADLTPEGGGHVFSDPTQVDDLSDDRVRDGGGRLTLRLFESTKPLISACNGVAVGVGATMQLAMDIRLASSTARYGFVFARRGIVEVDTDRLAHQLTAPDGLAIPALIQTFGEQILDASGALDRLAEVDRDRIANGDPTRDAGVMRVRARSALAVAGGRGGRGGHGSVRDPRTA